MRLKHFLSVFLTLLVFSIGQAWADEVAYTLTPVAGTNNSYTGNCNIDIEDATNNLTVTWNVEGNAQMVPWRIGGGKNTGLDQVNRAVYSKTAISADITKIEVIHGAASGITINSMTVIVSKNADFSNPVSTLTPTFAANNTVTVNRPNNTDWSNCYYKIIYNVSVGGTPSSHKYIAFTGAKFYKAVAANACAMPTFSKDEGNIVAGTQVTLSTETEGAEIRYTTNGDTPDANATLYNGPITVNADMTIKAIAIKDGYTNSNVASASYTALVPLTTTQAIFDKATEVGETATHVAVTFNNWVVTGVKSSNVFVTDGTKGFVIFTSNHGFQVGNILSGTAICKVQLYNNFAELTELPATKVTVNTGGSVSPVVLDAEGLAALSGVNTGSVIKISGTYDTNGKIAGVKLWNNLFSYTTPTVGSTYDCTGVYYYGGTYYGNEIMPRSNDDIVQQSAAQLEEVTGLAALKEEATGASYLVNLENAVVTYVSGNNAFIEDATAGALIYYSGHGLAAGNKLNGQYQVTTASYNGKFEITAMEAQAGAEKTEGAEIPVTTLTIAQLNANFAAFESRRVKIENVTVTDAVETGDATARTGEMSDGENTITLYGNNSVVAEEDAELTSIIGYPGFFNENHQFTLWAQDDIVLVIPTTKYRVRFWNSLGWDNVKVHIWNSADATEWPGEDALFADGWHYYDVEEGSSILFHSGTGTQTVDIVDITADVCYVLTGEVDNLGHKEVAVENDCSDRFYVAGTTALTGKNWDAAGIRMENGSVTFYNVAASEDLQFKVTNGTWKWNRGAGAFDGECSNVTNLGSDNVKFTTTEAKDITISYNKILDKICVTTADPTESWSTVKFMSVGNVFTSKIVPQGAEYTIELTTNPTRPGYTFAGWSADEIAEANAFTPLTSFTPNEENETLYAVFAKQTSPATTSFNKVTATDGIEDGEYLIVYEGDNTHDAVAFNGALETLDAANNGVAVAINEGVIAGSTELDAAIFTIAAIEENYSIQSAHGEYIGRTTNSNGMNVGSSAYAHSIAISNGEAVISTPAGPTLRYNYGSNDLRFRYYKSGQQPVQLYKKVVTPGTSVYTTSPAAVYHIAGDEALTGANWEHIALGEGNTVTYNNLPALTEGGYKFKITDGTWDFNKGKDAVDKDNSTGVTFNDNDADGNVVFMLAAESNVTITYDATNEKILVNAEPVIVPITYHIAGDEGLTGESWQHIALGEGNSITFNNVEAGTWEFKLTDGNSNWYGYGVIGVGEGSIDLADAGEPNHNIQFTLAAKSNVTITYDVDNNKVTVTAEAVIVPVSSNVVILAEYNSKFYAMTNSLDNGALAGVEVEKDGAKIVVTSEENKAAIQWTRTVTGDNTTLKDGNDKFIKGSNGASLSLNETYNWNWDGEKSCYISSAYPTRGLFFSNSGVFKGYALSNLETTSYAPIEVIEIAAEDIVVDVPVTHILSYNPNGGTLIGGETAIANADVAEGATVTVAANVYEKDGYMFTGWLYGETVYNAGQTFPMPTENVELVAQWSEVVVSDYVLVTDVAQLQAGDKVIIVAADYNVAAGSAAATYRNVVDITKTSDKSHLIFGASMPTEFTLGIPADGEYSFNDGDGFMYESAAKSVKVQEESFSWSISIDANAIATISASNALQYNSTSPRFTTYASGQSALQLYRKPGVTPPTPTDEYIEIRTGLTAGNYYTVCYPKAMSAIKGATLWSFAGADASMAYLVQEDAPYAAGKPYIIYAESDKLEAIVEGDEAAAGNKNGLYGTLADLDNAALVATGATHILKSNELRPIGNGHLDAQRAYIIASEIQGGEPQPAPGKKVRSMPMRQDAATGMDEINASETPVKMIIDGQLYILRGDKMYNANGQLVK